MDTSEANRKSGQRHLAALTRISRRQDRRHQRTVPSRQEAHPFSGQESTLRAVPMFSGRREETPPRSDPASELQVRPTFNDLEEEVLRTPAVHGQVVAEPGKVQEQIMEEDISLPLFFEETTDTFHDIAV